MSWWMWLAAPLAVGLFGILLLLTGFAHLLGGRVGRATGHVLGGAPLAVLGLAGGLLGLNTQTYARLSHEGPVATITVKALDPSTSKYLVTVQRLDGTASTPPCVLQGDEWVLSGRVQKWKPWANILGLDATYSLDQLTNMYFTSDRANGKPITSCDLGGGAAQQIDQYVPPGWLAWLADQSYTVDRRFGSANYMPLADGAVYKVLITQSGFNAEPDNDIARQANEKRG